MSTKVYGSSDDLIEFDGDVSGEVCKYGTDERERGVLLIFSDGTWLEAKYGKHGEWIWEIKLIRQGPMFFRIDLCNGESEDEQTDVAVFKDGLKWAYAATDWEKVA